MRLSTFAGLLGAVSMAGVANAASIGVSFEGGGSPANGAILDTANLGVTSTYQQTHWNNIIPNQPVVTGVKGTYTTALGDVNAGGTVATGGAFLDSSNAAVSNFTVVWAGIAASNSWTDSGTVAPADSGPIDGSNLAQPHNLYNGYLYTQTSGNTSLQFQNIPYSNYSIVVYADSGTATVSSNNGVTGYDGTTGLPTGGTSVAQGVYTLDDLATWTPATAVTAGNYFVISGLSGSDQTLTFVNATTGQIKLKAVQIVDAGGTAVPEPASLSLLGLGGLALIRRRRASN